jgi:hypothetical protein
MEATTLQTESEQEESIDIDWVESEWFQVWLELARHEREEESVESLNVEALIR